MYSMQCSIQCETETLHKHVLSLELISIELIQVKTESPNKRNKLMGGAISWYLLTTYKCRYR